MIPAVFNWFARRGWKPFDFQLAAWEAYARGRSGLIHAPTGVGKTLAAWMGPIAEALESGPGAVRPAEPLRVLWITPLRALASDTTQALLDAASGLKLNWTIEKRTGDSPAAQKRRQRERLPTALVTTPESLSLLLSYPDCRQRLDSLRCVVVDEWHELIGSKRGVQVELALARLRGFNPGLRTWGVSATIGNLQQAMDVLLGPCHDPARACLVQSRLRKDTRIDTVIPRDIDCFPWAGHLGMKVVREVIEAVESAHTTLLFTNTRSQAEIWFKRLLDERPDWLGRVAIHHGSLERGIRQRVEEMIADGRLLCVVCTSSLDLGVDFAPVDQVLQLGSPKGVGRLLQRGGRSGHRPGAPSRVLGVPTHAFELIEFAAARDAAAASQIESREPLDRPMDVLVQHLVTVACGGGFVEPELRDEVRRTHAFARLSDEEWSWVMEFVTRGGPALKAYPDYAKVAFQDGQFRISDQRLARLHRLSIGTITDNPGLLVRFTSGKRLGTIEEAFIGRLAVGDRFVFSGRVLELVRVRDMTAYVRRASGRSGIVPRWDGGRFSLSTQLAAAVRERLDRARRGEWESAGPEMLAIRPLLELQACWSRLPEPGSVLFEQAELKDGSCVFLFPFEGRMVHEGLGALLVHRISQRRSATLMSTSNDYGLCIHAANPLGLTEADWRELLSPERLVDDLLASMNTTELARRQFRDIARVAGLIVPGYPGARKPARHLQASSQMFFEVFRDFDPGNLLLTQARREVLNAQLEVARMRSALDRIAAQRFDFVPTPILTPMAFPIWAETLRSTHATSEKWSDVVARMAMTLEQSARKTGRAVVRKGARRAVAVGR